MFVRKVSIPFAARSVLQRTLHSNRVLYSQPDTSKPTETKPADSKVAETKPVESKLAESKSADSKPAQPAPVDPKTPSPEPKKTQEPDDEKIEYFGNTRFPKFRAKPRRTITPGDAIGQATPTVKPAPQTLKEQAQQKWRDILSPEKNLESRARIIHDIGHSYFQDIVDLRDNGDKLFEAPKQLIRSSKAHYLPSVSGKTLAGQKTDVIDLCRGKTTLLTVNFNKFSELHTNSFIDPFEAAFADSEDAQVVRLNIEENWAKAMVLQMCLPYLRRHTPKDRHANYLIHYGDVEGLRKSMGIANSLIGYVFLIDKELRVRWYGNGLAVMSEAQSMVMLTQRLIPNKKK
ncbi:Mitochondrial ATPase complex subunit atp10 [Coemansia sp. RSA 522]|nr:Mitochondrial ATPase complex subunit atp10 [Coemansia sp. RSA 522]